MKHKSRLYAHGGMQPWEVKYWKTYAPVLNCISVRSLLDIASIHRFPRRSIDFVTVFPQADFDVYFFMDINFGMVDDRNRG